MINIVITDLLVLPVSDVAGILLVISSVVVWTGGFVETKIIY